MGKKIISIVIGCFILFLILDGFSDFLLYSKFYIKKFYSSDVYEKQFLASLPEGADHAYYKMAYNDTKKLKFILQPCVGKVLEPGNYGIYSIDDKGKRVNISNKEKPPRPKKLLLLGSSQAFGYYSNDRNSLAFELSKLLPDYEIDNYSVPAQTALKTLAYWQKISIFSPRHYDLAIILSGPFDYISECKTAAWAPYVHASDLDKYRKPAIYSVPRILINRFFTKEKILKNICTNPEQQTFVASQIIRNLKNIIEYGESQKIRTLAFIPPTLWGNNANIENLKSILFPEEDKIFNNIQEKISRNASFEKKIIDLSHIFDDKKNELFLDTGSHFIPKGNRIISLEIAEYLNR